MKKFSVLIPLVAALLSCSVSGTPPLQKEFGDDAYFFMALQAADEGDGEKAIRFFKTARDSKGASEIISRKSAESLVLLGNVLERNESAVFLSQKYGDDGALLSASRELFRQKEYSTIIKITENVNFKNSPNELIKIRFNSMLEKRDSRFDHEYFLWMISRPISSDHIELYQKFLAEKIENFKRRQDEAAREYERELQARIEDWKKDWAEQNPEKSVEEIDESEIPKTFEGLSLESVEIPITEEQMIIDYRVNVFRKKYHEAMMLSDGIVRLYEEQSGPESTIDIDDQVLSDLGKAHLYGTDDYYSSAHIFDELSKKLEDEKAFYANFYAARLYDKGGRYQKTATARFRTALSLTKIPEKSDNCLWYLLNFALKNSTEGAIEILGEYGPKINSEVYFDDFFDSLSVLLLSHKKWDEFCKIRKIEGLKLSDETRSRFAYISGRLIEKGLAKTSGDPKNPEIRKAEAADAFSEALLGNGDLYYKVCALERLGISDETLVESAILNGHDADFPTEAGEADILMSGYAKFGFPNRVYSEWLSNREKISAGGSALASEFLFKCARHDPKYATQSLRIASRARISASGKVGRDFLERVYPRFFEEDVSEVCEKNGIPESVLYALVRTESFFDPSISSVAGAAGLTQLMAATAKDEARKLKMDDDFDILDPRTNLELGAHYLSSLIGRVEGNVPILALFAYNGGLTNVRRWISASKRNWATAGKIPENPAGVSLDIFLETVPFSETRGYGRQLVAGAAVYGWLYYGINPADQVRALMYAKEVGGEE